MESSAALREWFTSGSAYIDPNDHGASGYLAIPFLLMLYDRVVVHSPYAGMFDAARASLDDDRNLLILWEDLQSIAEDDNSPLLISAFPTYVDPVFDAQRPDEYRARKGRDDVRLDQSTSFYQRLLIVEDDPRSANALLAISHSNDEMAQRAATQIIAEGRLTLRYQSALEKGGNFRVPIHLNEFWNATDDRACRLAALATYDFLNDRTVFDAAGANTHCVTTAGEMGVDIVSTMEPLPIQLSPFPYLLDQLDAIRRGIIRTVEADKYKMRRLNVDFIRDFRSNYRQTFVNDIVGILVESSRAKTRERMVENAEAYSARLARLDRLPLVAGRWLEFMLKKLLAPFTLGLSAQILPHVKEYVSRQLPEFDFTRRRRWRYALREPVERPWDPPSAR